MPITYNFFQYLLDVFMQNLHNMPMMNETREIRQRQLKTFPIVLKSVSLITPGVKHFVFGLEKNAEGESFSYVAGQFITLHFEKEGQMLHRSYSVACAPVFFDDNQCIEFAAGYVDNGAASELLFNLKPGDSLNATGPFGRLILKEETPKRYIFVSTSTGVTPFRAMLNNLAERFVSHPELQVVLLQGVQHREDLLYKDDFVSFSRKYPQFTFYACYSREQSAVLESYESLGYVQKHFPHIHLNPHEDVVYLCGNPHMIDEAFLTLKESAFEPRNIFREKYISSK